MSSVHDLVARLRREGHRLSRNRNFDMFRHPRARRALRIHLMLQQLERDIKRYADTGSVTVSRARGEPPEEAAAGSYELAIAHEGLRFRRVVYLAPEELALLAESDDIADVLAVEGETGVGEGEPP